MSKLTPKQIEAGWTEEAEAAYVRERNGAAANRIFGAINGGINPATGKPRRKTVVEADKGGAHGWLRRSYDPHSAWRTKRNEGDF